MIHEGPTVTAMSRDSLTTACLEVAHYTSTPCATISRAEEDTVEY
jgi:hypothetical protein